MAIQVRKLENVILYLVGPNQRQHESPRITKLYDRTSDVISLDEIERIVI